MDLNEQIEEMKKIRGESYKPRTRHIDSNGRARYTNRLFLESSPYLLQHAHNPVDWRPWGDEAFEAARDLDRPVLLSVGYSTCHWCHVMEEESFEDEEVAGFINENYIAVKVDREERPDVDSIYMSAVQALTRRGGWPMTVWLTPDRAPFYGGTYFPARDGDRGVGVGFLTILEKLKTMYDGQREMVEKSSRELTGVVQKMLTPSSGSHAPGGEALARAAAYFKQRFDPVHGGAAGAPKFPATFPIRLFLRYFKRSGDAEALKMAAFTLGKMAAGGMYDHVGGGFHRYSVDERWHVPHFEKMLYDNALLASAYLEGWQATGEEKLRRIVVEIFDYVEREMTAPSGAFFSAADADSLTPDGRLEEGWFFTWTPDEVAEVVGRERARIVNRYYAIGVGPDFEGRYIPRAPETADAVARSLHMAKEELVAVVAECRELLRQARARRKAPLLDDKIITSWNGLMISALARAGLLLGDSRYTRRAEKAAGFILDRMYKDNRLFRTCRDGAPRHMGCLEDHAFFIAALLDLYEASHDPAWFEKSLELDQVLEARFEDKKEGGFFMTADDHENLIAREKPAFDGALPSGNAAAVHNLLRMALFTSRDAYRERANKALACFSTMLEENPAALSEMLPALDFSLDSPKQIVIVTPEGKKEAAEPFLAEFRKHFLPNRVLAAAAEGEDLAAHGRLFPFTRGKSTIQGRTGAYVCENGACRLPVSAPEDFRKQLE